MLNLEKDALDMWIKETRFDLQMNKCFSYTFGSEVVILIVSKTLSKLLEISSSVLPSINRSWPFGSVKKREKGNARVSSP